MDKFKENLKFIQRAEITQKKNVVKNNALSFEVTIVNNYDPSIQLADTRENLKEKLKTLIRKKRKGIKFYITLKVKMRKETEDGTIYAYAYFSIRTMTVTNKDQILEKIVLAEEVILTRIAVWLSERSGWVVEEMLNHYINVASYILTVGIFSKLRYNVNIDILTMLYYSLIYPFLIYGVQVWGLTYPTYLTPVTTLQKRIAGIMTFSEPMSHSEPLLKSLNLLKFNDIIHSEILSFVYQWFHKLVPSCFFGFFHTDILYT